MNSEAFPNYYNKTIQPEAEKPPEMFDQGEQKETKSCCGTVFRWIHQILLWLLIITEIILIITANSKNNFQIFIPLGFLGVLYIAYIIQELCTSPISQYLLNKSTDSGMYQKMRIYFSTPPEIAFSCECYHYETRTETSTDSEGNTTTTTVTERVVTYREKLIFPYYSGRDVSGLFYLNCDKDNIRKKKYLKLELLVEVNFADALSCMDYENEKNIFIERNKNKDSEFDFYELKTIPGMQNLNLIKIGESESCIANCCCFALFTFLTLAEIYKLYFNSICVYQKFKIRKLISTRYNITEQEFEEKYEKLNPQMNLIQQTYFFEPNEYNYLNNDFQVNLPTEEELQNSEQFKDKVPEYEISTGYGNYQPGVIIDKPGYDNSINPAPIALAQNLDDYNTLEPNLIDENDNDINNEKGVDLPVIHLNEGFNKTNQGYIPPNNK